jgi:hypothetical protein
MKMPKMQRSKKQKRTLQEGYFLNFLPLDLLLEKRLKTKPEK